MHIYMLLISHDQLAEHMLLQNLGSDVSMLWLTFKREHCKLDLQIVAFLI